MEDIELINLYWDTLPEGERNEIARIANRLRQNFKTIYGKAPFGEASSIEFLYRLGHFLNQVDPQREFVC